MTADIIINPIIEITKIEKNDLLLKIIKNNIFVIFFNVFGCFTFGFFTFLNTFYNGFIIGVFFKAMTLDFNISNILYHLLPHSLELVAIILSCAIGYSYSYKLFNYIFKNNEITVTKKDINIILITMFFIIFSAFMETYVSTNI